MTIQTERITHIYTSLIEMYGETRWEPDYDPLGGLIGTILSQHTSDKNSARTYQRLTSTFPTWEEVRDASTDSVAEAIRSGGLANIKAPRIQATLRTLTQRQQELASKLPLSEFLLQELNRYTPEEAWEYLQEIPGVGPKTAACVLMFNLGLPIMPVDTHVHRVSRRLGLIDAHCSANKAHMLLTEMIPPAWIHTFHVDLIHHGRALCHAQKPNCDHCLLYPECAYAGSILG